MRGLRLRALVLAAGRGERLRPLTDTLPKPLLPVLGSTILQHTLRELATLPVEAVAINLHHLGEQIQRRIGERFHGLPVTWSVEPERLGTSGALVPLDSFAREADLLLVLNGDTLCRWPLKRLVRHHRRGHARATLLMTRRADPGRFGGGVAIGHRGRVLAFGGPRQATERRRRVFAGAHVFAPVLLEELPVGPSDFIDHLYRPLLARGEELGSIETGRRWHDLGTPQRYLDGILEWVRRRWLPGPLGARGWRHPASRVEPGCRVANSILEEGVRVASGGHVEHSLLLTGCRLGPDCELRDSIAGPGVVLPEGTVAHRQLITRLAPKATPPPASSTLGKLVFTPLDAGPATGEAGAQA